MVKNINPNPSITRIDLSNTTPAFGQDKLTDRQLKKHCWIFKAMNNSITVRIGAFIVSTLNKIGLLKKWMIQPIFNQFCGGESPKDFEPIMNDLKNAGIKIVPDYCIEGGGDVATFDSTEREILRIIGFSAIHDGVSHTVFKMTAFETMDFFQSISGKLINGNVLSSEEFKRCKRLEERVEGICKHAHDNNVKVMIDAEETWLQVLIDMIVNTMMQKFNKEKVIVINTYQMYLNGGLAKLIKDHIVARQKGYILGAKVVRGAYMDQERAYAKNNQCLSPIQPTREATHKEYNKALEYCVKNDDTIYLFAGTHNEESIYYLTELLEIHNLTKSNPHIHIAQLYGMGDTISFNLAEHGYNVSKYLPYGKATSCLPYLIRRAYENSATKGMTSRELQLLMKERKSRNQLKI